MELLTRTPTPRPFRSSSWGYGYSADPTPRSSSDYAMPTTPGIPTPQAAHFPRFQALTAPATPRCPRSRHRRPQCCQLSPSPSPCRPSARAASRAPDTPWPSDAGCVGSRQLEVLRLLCAHCYMEATQFHRMIYEPLSLRSCLRCLTLLYHQGLLVQVQPSCGGLGGAAAATSTDSRQTAPTCWRRSMTHLASRFLTRGIPRRSRPSRCGIRSDSMSQLGN